MNQDSLLTRITSRPEVFGGKPIVRDLRISVESILGLMAQGERIEAILADYPALAREDVHACLAYARAVIANDSLGDVKVG